jgi:hypothetical protein
MGENYTRKTEHYSAARNDRTQNTQSQVQQKPTSVVYTCWKCYRDFDLPAPGRQDTVRCPHCEMVHGLITSK